jgi:hypothetical protein
MNPQMQNLNNPIIYKDNPQFNDSLSISSNANAVQNIPITPYNMSQVLMTPNLQPDTTYSRLSDSTPQESVVMNKHSFFYAPFNDFQMYHIICEEVPLSFESVSQLVINTNNKSTHNYVQPNNIFIFYHEQPEVKKIYQVTCEMVSHTFIFQFLNKTIYNIQFTQNEYQEQVFTENHQENLKFHLKKDLFHFLVPKYTHESMTNFNTNTFNNFQQYTVPLNQSFSSQQENSYDFQYYENNHNQGYDNYF